MPKLQAQNPSTQKQTKKTHNPPNQKLLNKTHSAVGELYWPWPARSVTSSLSHTSDPLTNPHSLTINFILSPKSSQQPFPTLTVSQQSFPTPNHITAKIHFDFIDL